MSKQREPLVRVVKRDRIHPLLKVAFYLLAILFALTVGGVLLFALRRA